MEATHAVSPTTWMQSTWEETFSEPRFKTLKSASSTTAPETPPSASSCAATVVLKNIGPNGLSSSTKPLPVTACNAEAARTFEHAMPSAIAAKKQEDWVSKRPTKARDRARIVVFIEF